MTDRETQITDFLTRSGWADARRERVAGDASNRRYDRLTDSGGPTVILMDALPEAGEDVQTFVTLADYLRAAGLSTPEIYHQDTQNGLLLIEDFGNRVFAKEMQADQGQQIPLYRAAADVLVHLQQVPTPDLQICDAAWLVDMLAPVFEWYAQPDQEDAVEAFVAAFRPLAYEVAKAETVLMLRDYHAENLLLLPERSGVRRVGILDFQDAMLAHPAYDLVSVLQDARRDVAPDIESRIIDYYLGQTSHAPEAFQLAFAVLGLQRNLRIIGIFARLGLRDGKPGYIDMIPRVWGYVQRNLMHPALRHLSPILSRILVEPTPAHLQHLREKCPLPPSPS